MISKGKKERVRELFDKGLRVPIIAERLALHASSVYGIVARYRKEKERVEVGVDNGNVRV